MKTATKVGIGVGVGVLALFGWNAFANAASNPGGTDPNAKAKADDNALAAQADAVFASALAAANATVSATAAAGSLGIGAAASAPLQIAASAAVAAAWKKLSNHDKADIWRGGGPTAIQAIAAGGTAAAGTPVPTTKPAMTPATTISVPGNGTSARGQALAGMSLRTTNGFLADFGLTISNPLKGPGGKLPGCSNPSPGVPAITCWIAQGIADQIHKYGLVLCANADSAYASLKSRGVPVPSNWSSLSCDQKMLFLLAMASPLGIALGILLGGAAALGAVLKSKQVAQITTAIQSAANSVGGAVASGVKDATDAISHAGGQVSDTYHKVFGGMQGVPMADGDLGACSCAIVSRKPPTVRRPQFADMSTQAPLPSANLPGSSFISPAGMVPTVATANYWTRLPSAPDGVSQAPQPKKPEFVQFNRRSLPTIF